MRINRRTKITISGVLILCFIAVALPAVAEEGTIVEKMGKKLGRGLVNVVTGWIELPKNIYDTSVETNNPLMGITYGTLKGVGMTVVRTGAGAYDVATFLFPLPEDYKPLLDPEFVFEEK
ncbi:MAG: exosortase system-associated protein, TIGR04073 family [Candidatus Omnitrophota bacterium]|nr:MAG: exosortase system-associated protein, TIGR04073 family [Candidatus Omnitrophota bacterium]